jgi:4-hydroxy-4-methyl-2-oxoglutarate aldolase
MGNAEEEDVFVVDNGGRFDEGCIGDFTAMEARALGIVAILV